MYQNKNRQKEKKYKNHQGKGGVIHIGLFLSVKKCIKHLHLCHIFVKAKINQRGRCVEISILASESDNLHSSKLSNQLLFDVTNALISPKPATAFVLMAVFWLTSFIYLNQPIRLSFTGCSQILIWLSILTNQTLCYRLYSDYLYFTKTNKSSEDFHQAVSHAVEVYKNCTKQHSVRYCVYNRTIAYLSKVS